MGYEEGTFFLECEDCKIGEDYISPKELLRQTLRKDRSCGSFGDIKDPIKEELLHLEQANLAYTKFPIVPFLDGGDANMLLLRRHFMYSPTHGSVISSQRDYVLGGEFDIQKKKDSGFFSREEGEEVSPEDEAQYKAFITAMNPTMDGDYLLEVAAGIFVNMKVYGNAYIKATRFYVAGQPYFYIENIDAEMVRYRRTKAGEDRIIMISPSWSTAYVEQNPPEFISVYPNFSTHEDGRETTILHCKNKVVNRDWYGLPDSISSLYFQYLEVLLGEYSPRGYANQWTGKKFIETESDEEGEDDGDFSRNLEMTFTYKGKGKNVLWRNRLPGEKQSFIYEFKDDKSWEFHKHESDRAEQQVIKSHKWHRTLMGMPTAGKLGENNERKELFKQIYYTVIRPYQKKVCSPINTLFAWGAEFMDFRYNGGLITDSLSLGLHNLHEDILAADIAEQTGDLAKINGNNGVPTVSGEGDAT